MNEGICSYEAFAREAAAIVGASSGLIDVVTEASMRRPAPRPGFTPMRPWQQALREYVIGERASRPQ